jgi:RNA recognition motif-containing protein
LSIVVLIFFLNIRSKQEEQTNKFKKVGEGDTASSVAASAAALLSSAVIPDDLSSTNLYVSNFSAQVTEAILWKEFSRFGQINSVKIMWPRTDDEKRRKVNPGFISFVTRPDAEKALNYMQGRDFYGVEMKIGWGKPVKINNPALVPQAIATATGLASPSLPSAASWVHFTLPTK